MLVERRIALEREVRIVTDFQELNKYTVRSNFPMPNIQDVMQNRGNYKCFTNIDLSMCYYCFHITEDSKEYTVTTHPNGSLLEYNRLPMGAKCSGDYVQMAMRTHVLAGLDVAVYIDNISIWSDGSYEDHQRKVEEVKD